jgi:hypothetical protein
MSIMPDRGRTGDGELRFGDKFGAPRNGYPRGMRAQAPAF